MPKITAPTKALGQSRGSKVSTVVGLLTIGIFTLVATGGIGKFRDWIVELSSGKQPGEIPHTNPSTQPGPGSNVQGPSLDQLHDSNGTYLGSGVVPDGGSVQWQTTSR